LALIFEKNAENLEKMYIWRIGNFEKMSSCCFFKKRELREQFSLSFGLTALPSVAAAHQ
jgi:hypothetical protein